MDALSDVLRVVRLTGGVYLEARLTAPWAVVGRIVPEAMRAETLRYDLDRPKQVVSFHYIISGRLIGQVGDGRPVALEGGDIILMPRNDEHLLASAPGVRPVSAGDLLPDAPNPGIRQIRHGGDGEETRMVCGFLALDAGTNLLVAALPPMLKLNVGATAGGAWIAQSFGFAAQQLAEGAPGAATIISKLSELMFVEAVRSHVENLAPEESGWLAGLRDPAIGKALALMHSEPERCWTVEELAAQANLSRSAFADRFAALIGEPPMRYLTHWRMQVAAQRLRDSESTVAQVAFDVGYESEAAFTRAFRREMGAPPAAWRRGAAPRSHAAGLQMTG